MWLASAATDISWACYRPAPRNNLGYLDLEEIRTCFRASNSSRH
jgi:hypothetical protein